MNLKIKRLLCIVLSVMTIASLVVVPTGITAAEKVIYVSPTGNDSGNGSISSPYKTIAKAKAAARSMNSGNVGGITIYLRGGEYYVNSDLEFTAADSGSKGNPIVYKAYQGEKVNIYGGQKISSSKITTASTTVSARVLDSTAKSKLMQIDLKSIYPNGIPKYYSYGNNKAENKYPFQVYCGDTALSRSRWPNADASYPYVRTTKKATQVAKTNPSSAGAPYLYYFDADASARVAKWSSAAGDDLFVHGFWAYEYNTEDCTVQELNRTGKSMTIVGGLNAGDWKTASTDTYLKNVRFYFFNLPEEIDKPGECYIDYDKSMVYFYPPANFDINNVFVSTLMDPIFGFYNAHDITLDGLTVKYTRVNAVDIRGAKGDSYTTYDTYMGITIQNCTFAHSSGNAISGCGTDINIIGCNIYDTGSGAIKLIGGNQIGLVSGNSKIYNCSIINFTRNEHSYEPAIEPASLGLLISHNHISGGIHQAIGSYNFKNNIVIEYNEIDHCVTECFDMGAVYYGRDLTVLGTVIRYNYFHDIGSTYTSSMQHSIYIDDGAFGADIYGNVFYKASSKDYEPAAIKLHAAQFSSIHNNIFCDMPYGIEDAAWGGTTPGYQQNWVKQVYNTDYQLFGRPDFYKFDSGIWRTTYTGTIWEQIYPYFNSAKIAKYTVSPYLHDALPAEALANNNVPYKCNKIADNVYVKMSKGTVYDVWAPSCNHTETNAYSTSNTSIFKNYGSDFTLTDSGLATVRASAKNFTNIPFSQIGSSTDFNPDPPTPPCDHTPGAAATCTTAQVCTKCGITLANALGHNYNASGVCTRCGVTKPITQTILAYSFDRSNPVGELTKKVTDSTFSGSAIAANKSNLTGTAASMKTVDGSSSLASTIGAAYAKNILLDSRIYSLSSNASSFLTPFACECWSGNGDSVVAFKLSAGNTMTSVDVSIYGAIAGSAGKQISAYLLTSSEFNGGSFNLSGKTAFMNITEESNFSQTPRTGTATANASEMYLVITLHRSWSNYSAAVNSTENSGEECISGYKTAAAGVYLSGVKVDATLSGAPASHTHTMQATAAKTATCKEAGNIAYWYCTGCQKYFSDANGNNEISQSLTVIPKTTNHSFGSTYSSDATGHWTTCTVCGTKNTVNSHIPNVPEATTTTAKYCVICQYVIEPKKGDTHTHTMQATAAKAATCKEAGNIAYWYCTSCQKYFSDANGNNQITQASTVIPKTATHSFGKVYSSDEAGHWTTCTVCGTKSAVSPHVSNVEKATETVSKYCVICGYVIESADGEIRGDANGNNKLEIDDVSYMLNYMLFKDFEPDAYKAYQNMDYDGNGVENIDDVTALLNFFLFGELSPIH